MPRPIALTEYQHHLLVELLKEKHRELSAAAEKIASDNSSSYRQLAARASHYAELLEAFGGRPLTGTQGQTRPEAENLILSHQPA